MRMRFTRGVFKIKNSNIDCLIALKSALSKYIVQIVMIPKQTLRSVRWSSSVSFDPTLAYKVVLLEFVCMVIVANNSFIAGNC